ncbi:MAG: hypothetical protein LEGION0398_MBIBDBAK_01024 [Legionellaceae bacterium]
MPYYNSLFSVKISIHLLVTLKILSGKTVILIIKPASKKQCSLLNDLNYAINAITFDTELNNNPIRVEFNKH